MTVVVVAHAVAVAHVAPVEVAHVAPVEESISIHPVAGEPIKPSMNTSAYTVHTTSSEPTHASYEVHEYDVWGMFLGAVLVLAIITGLLKRR